MRTEHNATVGRLLGNGRALPGDGPERRTQATEPEPGMRLAFPSVTGYSVGIGLVPI
jgi:hypothetical protein